MVLSWTPEAGYSHLFHSVGMYTRYLVPDTSTWSSDPSKSPVGIWVAGSMPVESRPRRRHLDKAAPQLPHNSFKNALIVEEQSPLRCHISPKKKTQSCRWRDKVLHGLVAPPGTFHQEVRSKAVRHRHQQLFLPDTQWDELQGRVASSTR